MRGGGAGIPQRHTPMPRSSVWVLWAESAACPGCCIQGPPMDPQGVATRPWATHGRGVTLTGLRPHAKRHRPEGKRTKRKGHPRVHRPDGILKFEQEQPVPGEKGGAPVRPPPEVDGNKLGKDARLDERGDGSDKAAALDVGQRPHLLAHPHIRRRAARKGAAHAPRPGRRRHRGGGGGGGSAHAGGALRAHPSRRRGGRHQCDQGYEGHGTCRAPPPRAGGKASAVAAPVASPKGHAAGSAVAWPTRVPDEGEAAALAAVDGGRRKGTATEGSRRGRGARAPSCSPTPRACLVRLTVTLGGQPRWSQCGRQVLAHLTGPAQPVLLLGGVGQHDDGTSPTRRTLLSPISPRPPPQTPAARPSRPALPRTTPRPRWQEPPAPCVRVPPPPSPPPLTPDTRSRGEAHWKKHPGPRSARGACHSAEWRRGASETTPRRRGRRRGAGERRQRAAAAA